MNRRSFLRTGAGAVLGCRDLAFLSCLAPVSSEEVRVLKTFSPASATAAAAVPVPYEKVFGGARREALVKVTRQAAVLGANAVVSVDCDRKPIARIVSDADSLLRDGDGVVAAIGLTSAGARRCDIEARRLH